MREELALLLPDAGAERGRVISLLALLLPPPLCAGTIPRGGSDDRIRTGDVLEEERVRSASERV